MGAGLQDDQGRVWRHVVISTHGTWLHGDPRGFRSRGHRIHSSGDYRNPPPANEHAGLFQYHKARCPFGLRLSSAMRQAVCRSLVATLLEHECRPRAVAVGRHHAHLLARLPVDLQQTRQIIGDAKRRSSRVLKTELPGAVWGAGGSYAQIKNREHFDRAIHYILRGQEPGAATWAPSHCP